MPAKKQDSAQPDPSSALRWDDVRLFLATYRSGNLGAAARRLGVDISTVSRRIAALEDDLGARLFDRSRRGLAPTRAAVAVLPAAEAMEAASARLAREATGLESVAEGVVRISVPPGMADVFVVPLLPSLREAFPRITIEIDASIRVLDLSRHETDLAMRTIRPEGADLVFTRVLSARSIAMASVELARRLGRVRSWSDAPWIVWDTDLASLPDARWTARHVDRNAIVLRTSHFASQLAGVVAGLGVALVAEPYARRYPLVPLRYDPALTSSAEAWSSGDIWLVGNRTTREVPRIDAVWRHMAEGMRALGRRPVRRVG